MTAKKTIRRSAVRKLPQLILNQGGMCYWCHRPIVHVVSLRDAGVLVSESHRNATFSLDGKFYKARIATIDHVIPLHEFSIDASSRECNTDNIVAACVRCNGQRNSEEQNADPTSED